MMNIAITGGIGAGKSTIVNQLKYLYAGANFFSMDEFVNELYREDGWKNWLIEQFDTCDRVEISRLAFANSNILAKLNAQSALKIGVKLGKALSENSMNFIEFPLLFETQMQDQFDLTVHITADFDTRVDRVVARGKKTRVEAEAVIAAQMSEDKKREMADLTIDTTNNTPEECAEEVSDAIYNAIVGECQ